MRYSRIISWILVIAVGLLWQPAVFVAQSPPTAQPNLTIHVVQRGENLFRIALNYGMTTEALAELNGITNPASIEIGQRLLVPGEAATAEAVSTQPTTTYTVQAGDTLESIAQQTNSTAEQIALLNNINNSADLTVGQILNIAAQSSVEIAAPAAVEPVLPDPETTIIHTVAAGETTFRIATNYGITVNDIAEANGLVDPTRIFTGQQLIIPGTQPAVLAVELPDSLTDLRIKPPILKEGESGSIRLKTPVSTIISGTFLNQELRVISTENNTQHAILIGIPIFTESGNYPIQLNLTANGSETSQFTFDLQVISGNYATTNINISTEMVNLLSPAVEANELFILENLTSQFTTHFALTSPLGLPAAAPMNAPYGVRRSYNNGEVNRYHSGADFAGAPGTPILAAAPGRVVLADNFNIRGLSTVIDHGWGIYTLYAHQQTQLVEVGQMVETGQQIGTIGSSGRVTGPHLHWEVWVNGVAVNPLQWVQMTFP